MATVINPRTGAPLDLERAIDWEGVRADYRLGTLSDKALGAKYGVTPRRIRVVAKRDGWERDLAAKVATSRGGKMLVALAGPDPLLGRPQARKSKRQAKIPTSPDPTIPTSPNDPASNLQEADNQPATTLKADHPVPLDSDRQAAQEAGGAVNQNPVNSGRVVPRFGGADDFQWVGRKKPQHLTDSALVDAAAARQLAVLADHAAALDTGQRTVRRYLDGLLEYADCVMAGRPVRQEITQMVAIVTSGRSAAMSIRELTSALKLLCDAERETYGIGPRNSLADPGGGDGKAGDPGIERDRRVSAALKTARGLIEGKAA